MTLRQQDFLITFIDSLFGYTRIYITEDFDGLVEENSNIVFYRSRP